MYTIVMICNSRTDRQKKKTSRQSQDREVIEIE